MKRKIKFLAILLLISFSSCDEIDDATSVDFSTVQKASIPVNITAGDDLSINESSTINIDNNDTHDYLDLLKKVTIEKLSYKIINFTGDSNGTIDVDFTADNVVLASHSIVVKTTANNATVFEITDSAALSTIASNLKSGKSVTFAMKGTSSSESKMDFKVEITLNLKVKAGIL